MFAQQTTGSSAQPSPHHVKGLAGKGEACSLDPAHTQRASHSSQGALGSGIISNLPVHRGV